MPMRKYMGISITSQKRKKRKRSRDRKTPTTPTSSIRSMTKNSFTRCLMLVQEARTEMAVRKVVRMTRKRLMPSSPR